MNEQGRIDAGGMMHISGHSILSQLASTITTTGTGSTSANTVYHTLGSPGNGYYMTTQEIMEMMDTKKEPVSTTDIDNIQAMITHLEGSENELQQNAVKHLEFAKAYLEKMMLTVINERL